MSRAARQRGVAAVEMAMLMPVMLLILAAALFFGRLIYHYQVMVRATHDAALFLSTVPASEMKSSSLSAGELSLVTAIISSEIAQLGLAPEQYSVTLLCDGASCGFGAPPAVVQVQLRVIAFDDIFGFYSGDWGGYSGVTLSSVAVMRYVGK